VGTKTISLGEKWLGHEANLSSLAINEVKSMWNYTSVPYTISIETTFYNKISFK
jgi:hypothetical protein